MPEFCRVEREGRVLVVTLAREEVLNALHPPANSLEKAYRPGMGRYLPDRLFWAREERDALGEAPEVPRADARDAH